MAMQSSKYKADFANASFALRFKVCVPDADRYSTGESYMSPVHNAGKLPLCLEVYPKGSRGSPSGEDVGAFVKVVPPAEWFSWQFKDIHFAITPRGDETATQQAMCTFSKNISQVERITSGGFWSFSRLPLDKQRLPGALLDGMLCFSVAIWGEHLEEEPDMLPVSQPRSLACLWTEPKIFADVVIRVSSGTEFKCHRNVLSSCSEVLKRMLQSEFQEAKEATIELRDAHESDVRAMLEFMYTGKFSHSLRPGLYNIVYSGAVSVRETCKLSSNKVGTLRMDDCVNVFDVENVPEMFRVRGRIEEPIAGWITLTKDGVIWAVPKDGQRSYDLVKLCHLADMYDVPDLTNACISALMHIMAERPTHDNVRSMAEAMRKRPRGEAGDELLNSARRRIQSEPALIDALLSEE